MEAISAVLSSRISRLNLDPAKSYTKVVKKGEMTIEEPVGRFVRAYRMGSGDGMTAHWEFNKDGVKIVIDDEMWGPLDGSSLLGFREDGY
jgi:hypothetical protein